jgi:hypothetical protein
MVRLISQRGEGCFLLSVVAQIRKKSPLPAPYNRVANALPIAMAHLCLCLLALGLSSGQLIYVLSTGTKGWMESDAPDLSAQTAQSSV